MVGCRKKQSLTPSDRASPELPFREAHRCRGLTELHAPCGLAKATIGDLDTQTVKQILGFF